ncbi:hypothetical protein ALC57_11606 [Trachymyrmex cornetzi]|uniref:Uncharacterized protein n=1 Tax=Trachymyrmex cornetzi TaxID=471704 RepID=A0A151J276_9HYME|nr:hypothetical protein ALC57_11606 [Trachymyrmex cornetzi]
MNNDKYVIVEEFKDELQIIPITWLTTDLKRAKWPNCYKTNKIYDKAVRHMEEPESIWEEHPVIKIYATYVARRKLKLAEELLDINTCSEKEDYLKKSRKIRAAKTYSSSDYNSEQSDEEIISSLPKPLSKPSDDKGTSKKEDIQPHTRKNTIIHY